MTQEVHNLVLTKHMGRARNSAIVEGQIDKIIQETTESGIRMTGWKVERDLIGSGDDDTSEPVAWSRRAADKGWDYEVYLKVVFEHETKLPIVGQLGAILNSVSRYASQNNQGRWALSTVNGVDFEDMDTGDTFVDITIKGDTVEYATVNLPSWTEFKEAFSHLYGLDDNLELIYSALESGDESNWENRYNCALIGPPGCGKSDICQTLKKLLGDDAVWELDAVATTKAGAQKVLAERDVLPRIVVIEEGEKTPNEDSLTFLLSILDIRSSIRKVTARANVEMEAKLFAVMTVNDKAKFERLSAGALADRFPHKIHFTRPDRAMLAKILAREIEKVDGDKAWIKPCLDYCDAYNYGDGIELSPRTIIAWCLTGKDKWLTGRFQKILNSTQEKQVRLAVDEELEVV